MSREIKFKAWHPTAKIMSIEFTLMDAMEHEVDKTSDDEIHLQFTGLIDCQGVEIYEGDILIDYDQDYIGVVSFENGAFIVTWENEFCNAYEWSTEVVVGNIYENPEILEIR